jgi:hypothetical protein
LNSAGSLKQQFAGRRLLDTANTGLLLVTSTNKTDRHDITDMVLKVALSTIALTQCNGLDGMRVQKEHVLFMLDKY